MFRIFTRYRLVVSRQLTDIDFLIFIDRIYARFVSPINRQMVHHRM